MDLENLSLEKIKEQKKAFDSRKAELYPDTSEIEAKKQKDVEYHKRRIEEYEEMLKENDNSMDSVQKASHDGTIKQLIEEEKAAMEKVEKDATEQVKQIEDTAKSDINLVKQRRLAEEKSAYYTQAGMKLEAMIKDVELDMQIVLQRGDEKTKHAEYAKLQDKLNELREALTLSKEGKQEATAEINEFYAKHGMRSFKDAEEELDKQEAEAKKMTAMKKYETQVAQYEELVKREEGVKAELDEITAKLEKNPDDKDLQARKAKLEASLEEIAKRKLGLEKDIAEGKKLLGIKDEKDKDGDDKGEDDKGGEDKDGDDKGKKGDPKRETPEQYWDRLTYRQRHATKVDTYAKQHDVKPSFITKGLLWIPVVSSLIVPKKRCIQYLQEGWIEPRYGLQLLSEGEKPEEKSEERPTPKPEEKKKDPFELSEEDKKKVLEADEERRKMAEIQEKISKLSPEAQAKVMEAMKLSVKADEAKKETKKPEEKGEGR